MGTGNCICSVEGDEAGCTCCRKPRRGSERVKVTCPQMWYRPEGKTLPRPTDIAKKELKRVSTIFWPVSCTQFLIIFIPLSTTFFLGHINKTTLAGAGLALAITNVTGLSIGFGLAMGLDTLMNQAIGAKNYKRVGILLQRAILILGIGLLPIIGLWLNIKHLLLAIKQHENVAELTEEFVLCYIPSLLFNAFYQVLEKFLVCQKIVRPLIASSLFGVLINLLFSYLFVNVWSFGMRGGAFAINLSYLSMCLFLLIAIKVKGWHKKTWQGWSWECLEDWGEFMKFALPTLAMVCIEWWSFEIGTLIIGTKGDLQLAAQTITFNLASINFMFAMGFAVAATVQVGHYLGAGHPEMALLASRIASILTLITVGAAMLILFLTRNYIGYIFTSNREVVALTAAVIPLTAAFGLMDGFQCVCSGIIRGAGLQRIGVIINFIGYDIIAIPLAIVLALILKLLIKGLWIGLACGLLLQCVAFHIIIWRMDWSKQSFKAVKRSAPKDNAVDKPSSCHDNSKPPTEQENSTELTELVNKTSENSNDDQKISELDGEPDNHLVSSSNENNEPSCHVAVPRGRQLVLRRLLMLSFSLSIFAGAIVTRIVTH